MNRLHKICWLSILLLLTLCTNTHAQTWEELNDQGVSAYSSGNWRLARVSWEKAREKASNDFGEKHESYIISTNNLAIVLGRLNYIEEAIALFEESKYLSLEVLGKMHPEHITALRGLLDARRRSTPKHQQLAILLKEWLGVTESREGKESEEYLKVQKELAHFYQQTNNTEEALKNHQALAELYLQKYSSEDSLYLAQQQIIKNLENTLEKRKIYEDAQKRERIYRLGGSPYLGGHYFLKQLNFPQGTMGVRLQNEVGESFYFEQDFAPREFAHSFELNLFGVISNDAIEVNKASTDFNQNSYLYWSARASYSILPRNNPKQTLGHFFELGADFGLRLNPSKHFYLEMGLQTIPFALYFIDIGTIEIPTTNLGQITAEGTIENVQFGMYLGVAPFLRTGFYFNKKQPWSIDCTLGYQQNWIYFSNTAHIFYLNPMVLPDVLEENFNPKTDFLINNEPRHRRDFTPRGLFYGIGLSFYFL